MFDKLIAVLSFLPNTTYDLLIDLSKLGDESKYTIDYLGDKNANTLTGTTNRSVLNGALEVFGQNAAVVIANPNDFKTSNSPITHL
jgi:hypothetical protein